MKDQDRYCEKCGARMVTTPDHRKNWVKFILPNYDELTGEKIDYSGLHYKCPNDRWWNSHDSYFIQNLT